MTTPARQPQDKLYLVSDTLITAIGEWDKVPHDIVKILALLRSRPHTSPPAPNHMISAYAHGKMDGAKAEREKVLDAILKRLEKQGVEIHERNGQRYYVVEGTFNFASFMQWLESLRAQQESQP